MDCDSVDEFLESRSSNGINPEIDSLLRIALGIEILLGLDADHGLGESLEELIDTLVFFAIGTSRIEETEDDFCFPEGCIGFSIDPLIDLGRLLTAELFSTMVVDSRSVEKYNLDTSIFISEDPWYGSLGGLRSVGNG